MTPGQVRALAHVHYRGMASGTPKPKPIEQGTPMDLMAFATMKQQ